MMCKRDSAMNYPSPGYLYTAICMSPIKEEIAVNVVLPLGQQWR